MALFSSDSFSNPVQALCDNLARCSDLFSSVSSSSLICVLCDISGRRSALLSYVSSSILIQPFETFRAVVLPFLLALLQLFFISLWWLVLIYRLSDFSPFPWAFFGVKLQSMVVWDDIQVFLTLY